MSFAPMTNPNGDLHRRQLAVAANAALRAETANTGAFTVPSGSEEYTLRDARLGVGKVLLLCPTNAEAAKARWYVPAMLNGTATIAFYEHPSGDAAFSFAVVGAGNTKGL